MCLQAQLHVFKLLLVVDAKSDVVDPGRRVWRSLGDLIVAEVEKRDEGAILQAEEKVGVGAVLAGAGYMVALDDVIERQAQDVLIEMPGFLGIAGPVREVVQLLHRGRCRQRQGAQGQVFECGGHGFCSNAD